MFVNLLVINQVQTINHRMSLMHYVLFPDRNDHNIEFGRKKRDIIIRMILLFIYNDDFDIGKVALI